MTTESNSHVFPQEIVIKFPTNIFVFWAAWKTIGVLQFNTGMDRISTILTTTSQFSNSSGLSPSNFFIFLTLCTYAIGTTTA